MRDANKIIYSMKVMEQLVRKGFVPLCEIPNSKNPKFKAWVFEWSDAFDTAFDEIQTKSRGDFNGRE